MDGRLTDDAGRGPPVPSPPALYASAAHDEESELLIAQGDGPDDLGDLMMELREGGAWAEGLAMDCEQPLPPQQPPGAQQPAQQQPPADPLSALLALSQRTAAQQAAEAAGGGERELQPAVRALLMHPPALAPRPLAPQLPLGLARPAMVPVGIPIGVCYEPEAALQPLQPGAWPSRPPPSFFGVVPGQLAPSPPPGLSLPAFAPGQPLAPPCFAPGAPPHWAFYKPPPAGMGAPPPLPPLPLPPAPAEPQRSAAQPPSGPAGLGLEGELAARFALAQQAAQQAQQATQQPAAARSGSRSGSGSGDASDGTVLRLRSMLDTASGAGSALPPLTAATTAGVSSAPSYGFAPPPPHHHHHHSHHHHRYSHHSLPLPLRLDSAAGLAAFNVAAAAFDAAAAALGAEPLSSPTACGREAPSDCSDCEDGCLDRQFSAPQVVPDASALLGCSDLRLPLPPALLDLPEFHRADAARAARHASLERFRLKKARRARAACAGGGGAAKRIRYQARKDNADRRPRVKGRFVKAEEEASIMLAAALEHGPPCSAAPSPASTASA